jgi:hypothetical protein
MGPLSSGTRKETVRRLFQFMNFSAEMGTDSIGLIAWNVFWQVKNQCKRWLQKPQIQLLQNTHNIKHGLLNCFSQKEIGLKHDKGSSIPSMYIKI